MRHQAVAITNRLLGGILQTAGGYPRPDCFRVLELVRYARVAVDELVELRLGRHIRPRITPWINCYSYTDNRVSRERVVIKWDNPEPAALETMVQRAFMIRNRQRVVSFIERGHIHHVC